MDRGQLKQDFVGLPTNEGAPRFQQCVESGWRAWAGMGHSKRRSSPFRIHEKVL
jgi:hypothetical protein